MLGRMSCQILIRKFFILQDGVEPLKSRGTQLPSIGSKKVLNRSVYVNECERKTYQFELSVEDDQLTHLKTANI